MLQYKPRVSAFNRRLTAIIPQQAEAANIAPSSSYLALCYRREEARGGQVAESSKSRSSS